MRNHSCSECCSPPFTEQPMKMDLSSKDWAGVTNEEIPGHEECSPWPEACVNLTQTQLQHLKYTTEIKDKPPVSLSVCNTWKCCLQLLLTAGKCQRFGRTTSSAGFVVSLHYIHLCLTQGRAGDREGTASRTSKGEGLRGDSSWMVQSIWSPSLSLLTHTRIFPGKKGFRISSNCQTSPAQHWYHASTGSSAQTLPVWPGEAESLKFTMPASHLFRSENVYSKDCALID